MDHHRVSAGGRGHDATVVVPEPPLPAEVLFIAAVVLAVTGSAIMIVGHTFPVILLARVIQGIAGVATPLMMSIILEQSPAARSAASWA